MIEKGRHLGEPEVVCRRGSCHLHDRSRSPSMPISTVKSLPRRTSRPRSFPACSRYGGNRPGASDQFRPGVRTLPDRFWQHGKEDTENDKVKTRQKEPASETPGTIPIEGAKAMEATMDSARFEELRRQLARRRPRLLRGGQSVTLRRGV